jgi:hypothetical protein
VESTVDRLCGLQLIVALVTGSVVLLLIVSFPNTISTFFLVEVGDGLWETVYSLRKAKND